MDRQHYALHDPDTGRWYYLIPGRNAYHVGSRPTAVRIDGQPAEIVDRDPRPVWCVTAAATGDLARTVEADYPTSAPIVAWLLRDDLRGSQLPDALTPDEFRERTRDQDESAVEFTAYSPRYGEAGVETITVDTAGLLVLDGAPPPPHAGTWTAQLPHELANHREYLHLFPGRLDGLRDDLDRRLEQIPGVECYTSSSPVSVHVRVQPEVPPPPGSRRSSRQRGAQPAHRTITRQFPRFPYSYSGPNLADAVAAYERDADLILQWARETAAGRWCSHCEGTGIVSGTVREGVAP